MEIEKHWTAQIQNQQQRVSAILSVNGFLLGFLASVGFSEALKSRGYWPRYLFLASLIVLSLALMMGILSLMPVIRISGPDDWLDSERVFRQLTEEVPEEEAFRDLTRSLVDSQVKADHPRVLQARRILMYCELTLLLLGLMLLVAALIAFQVSGR